MRATDEIRNAMDGCEFTYYPYLDALDAMIAAKDRRIAELEKFIVEVCDPTDVTPEEHAFIVACRKEPPHA